jgi:hypothetical protein
MRDTIEHAKDIHAILCKPTGKFIAFGPKSAWNGPGAAKLAFKMHTGKKLEECDAYELVNLTEAYFRLKGLEE